MRWAPARARCRSGSVRARHFETGTNPVAKQSGLRELTGRRGESERETKGQMERVKRQRGSKETSMVNWVAPARSKGREISVLSRPQSQKGKKKLVVDMTYPAR